MMGATNLSSQLDPALMRSVGRCSWTYETRIESAWNYNIETEMWCELLSSFAFDFKLRRYTTGRFERTFHIGRAWRIMLATS